MKPSTKRLLFSFIGTTLSIVLTFGTTVIYYQWQKRQAQHIITMMTIHDMDVTIEHYKKMLDTETADYATTHYVMTHIDKLDSVQFDTIQKALSYLIEQQAESFDDSKEKVFSSGYESWNNVDNAVFVDLVQEFYYKRRQSQEGLENHSSWQKPISEQEWRAILIDLTAHNRLSNKSMREVLKDKLKTPEVAFFMDKGPSRRNHLSKTIGLLQYYTDRCKFLMGITDDDMREFLKNRNMRGRIVKPEQLVGSWKLDLNLNETIVFNFRADGTVNYMQTKKTEKSFWLGHMNETMAINGTWSLNDDTLIVNIPLANIQEYALDSAGITYSPQFADSVRNYYDQISAYMSRAMEEIKKDTTSNTIKTTVRLDRTGNTLEIFSLDKKDDPASIGVARYATRQ